MKFFNLFKLTNALVFMAENALPYTGSNSATLSTAYAQCKCTYGNRNNGIIIGDDVLLIDTNDISIIGGDGNNIAQVIGDTGVTLNLVQSHIEAEGVIVAMTSSLVLEARRLLRRMKRRMVA